MDLIGGIIARLDPRSPIWADRLRWRRARGEDGALRVVDELVGRGSTVLDIGAHRGTFSARMRDLVGPRGTVHAFEPNPEHLARLRLIGADGRVALHPLALSDTTGTSVLHIPLAEGGSGLASLEQHGSADEHTVVIATMRLDDVAGLPEHIDFIKCDVEGHEDAVIRGAERVIARSKPPILVEIEQRHRSASPTEAFDTLLSLGYAGWALFPTGLKPLECFDLQRDQLAFVEQAPRAPIMPRAYVHNFLFAVPTTDLGALLAPDYAQAVSSSRA